MAKTERSETGLDFRSEAPISFRTAVEIIPGPDGKHYHWRTIRKWALRGLLEAGRIGGNFCTSREACARFLQRQQEGTPAAAQARQAKAANYRMAKSRLKQLGIT